MGNIKRITVIFSLFALSTLVLFACSQGTTDIVKVAGGSYRVITQAQLRVMIDNKDFLLVKYLTFGEDVGEITGTDLTIYDIEQGLDNFSQDRVSKIVIYDLDGNIDNDVARALTEDGYTNVMVLRGGLFEWGHLLYPVEPKGCVAYCHSQPVEYYQQFYGVNP